MEQALPKKFIEEMKALLPKDFEQYIKSLSGQVRSGLRVNTLKADKEEIRSFLPFELTEIPWIEDGYIYDESAHPAKNPAYAAGLYYLQEPSAMTPADRLPIESGDRVLDLCAAPGGKATKLACKLGGTGMLFANDISNSRAKALLKNLELFGVSNICVMSEKPEKLEVCYPEYFDKILIDAPCSGEGMFHKEPRMVKDWEKKGPDFYAPIQRELLEQAYAMLRPGGMMLFSTCTFAKKENEENVRALLEAHQDLTLAQMTPYEGFSKGEDGLERCVRIFPHRMSGEGHFLALFEKAYREGERREQADSSRQRQKKLSREAEEFLRKLTWNKKLTYYQVEERLYGLPEGFVPHKKIRYLRTGLYLGDVKKNRFEPSQALAMALHAEEFSNCIRFDKEDYRVIRYLKGETIEIGDQKVEKGYCLVCIDRFPIGWGSVQKGILKNRYYSGWRWQ